MFEQAFPFFMAIGMTAEEYWEGDPHLAPFYYQAYKLRFDMQNQQAWLNGLYVFNAVSTALSNAFSKRSHKYVEKPFEFGKTEEAKEQADVQKEREKAISAFKQMRQKWVSEHGNTGT